MIGQETRQGYEVNAVFCVMPYSLPVVKSSVARTSTSLFQGFKESKVDEETRQGALDHVGFLFAYIGDKDIFHKYYSKLLSKRIIQLTSVSDEAEERMLQNMRKVRADSPPQNSQHAR